MNDDEWKFIGRRREKRRREGKDPGPVWAHERLIPEPTVRKEVARHVQLTAQYTDMMDSGMYLDDFFPILSLPCFKLPPFIYSPVHHLDPKTPEGIFVGTPRSEITGTVSDDPPNILAMDWCQTPSTDLMDFYASTPFWPGPENPLAFQFGQPGLHSSGFYFPGSEVPSAAPFNIGDGTLEYCLPELEFAGTTASPDRSSHVQHIPDSMINEIASEARLTLLEHLRKWKVDQHSDLTLALEPIAIGNVNNDLTRRAKAIFQSTSPENLSHYIRLCVYLSSNNLMPQQSTDNLVLLIAKSRSQSSLKALLKPTTATIEIFMSNLLASAAAMGDGEICRILIEAGADLDALSGLDMRTTPLQRALQCGKMECARMLLEAGADPNLAIDGETP